MVDISIIKLPDERIGQLTRWVEMSTTRIDICPFLMDTEYDDEDEECCSICAEVFKNPIFDWLKHPEGHSCPCSKYNIGLEKCKEVATRLIEYNKE